MCPILGDLRPITFLGQPLLMARGRDGVIRVFENVCRHRGVILVSEPADGKPVIRCPYHSWCYGLDGNLVTTPHVGGAGHNTHPEIKREELGLFEVRSYVWLDMVFVNISRTAPEFRDYAADLIERFKEFDQASLHHGGSDFSFNIHLKANWKLAVENYAESYHLPWIHPGLNSYSRLEDHYNMVERTYSGQGLLPTRRASAPMVSASRSLRDFRKSGGRERNIPVSSRTFRSAFKTTISSSSTSSPLRRIERLSTSRSTMPTRQ